MKGKNHFRWDYLSVFAAYLFLMLVIFNSSFKTTLEIFYRGQNSNSLNGCKAAVYWTDEGEFSEDFSDNASIFKRHVSLRIPTDQELLNHLRIDFTDGTDLTYVDRIEIRSGIFLLTTISPQTLIEYGEFRNTDKPVIDDGSLAIQPESNDSQYIMDSSQSSQYGLIAEKYEILSKVALWMLNTAACTAIFYLIGRRRKDRAEDTAFYVKCICIVIVLGLIVIMAAMSSTFAHPDEDVSAAAINYYLKYWGRPDFTTPEALNSFSDYGSSRLLEGTVYYFLAGKIGILLRNFLHIFAYFRGLNVLLFAALAVLFWKYGKKCPWLFAGMMLTPQLWYLFSYATSDAWDYFLAFMIIFLILFKGSGVNQALDSDGFVKKIGWIFALGVLFGLLLLGKQNYYLVFLLAFTIFLFRWYKSEKKILLLKKYLLICITCFGAAALLNGVGQLDDQQGYLVNDLRTQISSEKSQDASSLSQNLKDQGISLMDVLNDYKFGETSFKSFTGYYGWMSEESGFFYYLLIGALYFNILLIHGKKAFKEKGELLIKYICAWVMAFISFFVSWYHSWTSDFQAQGRYLLPILFIVMWMDYEVDERETGKWEVVTALAGTYSFIVFGFLKLI